MAKILISITCAKDNTDKASVAMVVANAALVSSQEAIVFFSTEGVHLAVKGYADEIHEEGFAPMKDLLGSFIQNGGAIWVCTPCFKKRNLAEDSLVKNAKLVGGATLVEAMSQGAACISY
jgi:predicted peroxiredoxin